jgi:hypothetical protein
VVDALGYISITAMKFRSNLSNIFDIDLKSILDAMYNIEKFDYPIPITTEIMPKEEDKIFKNKAGSIGKTIDLILNLLMTSTIPLEYKVLIYLGKLLIDILIENNWINFDEFCD